MNQLGLGYLHLNPDEKFAYDLIYQTFLNHDSSCDISKVKRNVNTVKIIQTVLGDNPSIVYFNKTLLRTMSGIFGKQMSLAGCLTKIQAIKKEEQLKKALEDAVWQIDKSAHNDREILQGITEYLQKNVLYDYDELNSISRGRSRFHNSHNAYGALINRKAVCDGFSSAYSLIAQFFGFKTMLVEGKSSYNNTGKVDHAWNIVEYENKFYHIDATWDANTYAVSKKISYSYFGLDDDEISLDHDWDYHYTPICNSNKLSYYWCNGLVAQSESQIESIIVRELRKCNTSIHLRILDSIALPMDADKYWAQLLPIMFGTAGVYRTFKYIWSKHTRCLSVFIE